MMRTTLEAFLLIEQPRQRLGHWTTALAALDSPLAPAPTAVVAYYDPTSDEGLINLVYDEAMLGANRLEFVVNVALLAEIGMVQPGELSEGERIRFLAARLSRCTIRVVSQSTVIGALTELAREIRRVRAPQSKTAVPATQIPLHPTPQPPMPVLPVVAKGTRDNLERYQTGTEIDDVEMDLRDSEVIILDELKPPRVEEVDLNPGTSRHVIPRVSRHATVEMPPETASLLARAEVTRDKEARTTAEMAAV
jgi:hypothetical protein